LSHFDHIEAVCKIDNEPTTGNRADGGLVPRETLAMNGETYP
jgi:hypothetical protein